MRFELSTLAVISRFLCLVVGECAIFSGANPLRSTPSNTLSITSRTNIGTCACDTTMQFLWMKLRLGILQLEHGSPHWGYLRGWTKALGVVVGILAFLLPSMVWIHGVGKYWLFYFLPIHFKPSLKDVD